MTTIIDTPEGIDFYTLCVLSKALKLEILGLHRSKAPSALSALRQRGYRGNRATVLAAVEADLARRAPKGPRP